MLYLERPGGDVGEVVVPDTIGGAGVAAEEYPSAERDCPCDADFARFKSVADIGGFSWYQRSSPGMPPSRSASCNCLPSAKAYSNSFGGGPSLLPLRRRPVAPSTPVPPSPCHAKTISRTSSSSSSSGHPNQARQPPAPNVLAPAADGGNSPRAMARWIKERDRRRTKMARRATETEVTRRRTRTERNCRSRRAWAAKRIRRWCAMATKRKRTRREADADQLAAPFVFEPMFRLTTIKYKPGAVPPERSDDPDDVPFDDPPADVV